MTEGNWDVSGVEAEFVDVPLGGVWTAPDGSRYRCVGGGCSRCAFLRPPTRVGKTGVETTCANQLDADLNGGERLACFAFERRDGVGVRFERIGAAGRSGPELPLELGFSAPVGRKSLAQLWPVANRFGGRLRRVAAWFGECWDEEPGSVVLAVAALVWLALVAAKIFG